MRTPTRVKVWLSIATISLASAGCELVQVTTPEVPTPAPTVPASGADGGDGGDGAANDGQASANDPTDGASESTNGEVDAGANLVDAGNASPDANAPSVPVGDCKSPSHVYNANETKLVNLPANSWWSAPNTKFLSACQPVERSDIVGIEGCGAVIHSWSGGAWTGRQMLVWGGGHGAYFGNEVYGFEPATLAWKVHTTPSAIPSNFFGNGGDPLPDGKPNSRHTYDQIAFASSTGEMVAYGGALAPDGWNSRKTWHFKESSKTWIAGGDLPPMSGSYWGGSAYDPVTKKVYIQDGDAVRVYDPAPTQRTWNTLHSVGYDGYKHGFISVARRLFFAVGAKYGTSTPRVFALNVDSGANESSAWSAIASGAPFQNNTGVGADVDLATGDLVAWAGGAPWSFDFATKQWTTLSGVGAPTVPNAGIAAENRNGTYGRFRYLPQYNVFMLVNDEASDVLFFKKTPGCG